MPPPDSRTGHRPTRATSGEHTTSDCADHAVRIRVLEERTDEHSDKIAVVNETQVDHARQLGDGRVMFERLGGKLESLTDAINRDAEARRAEEVRRAADTQLPKTIGDKITDAAISTVTSIIVTAVLIALLWAVVQSGAIVVKPPQIADTTPAKQGH